MQRKVTSRIRKLSSLFLLLFLLIAFSECNKIKLTGAGKDWPVYFGDKFSSHYSKLKEINRDNVDRLKVAWEYRTGDDVSGNHTQIQCNPIIIDGILYATSPRLKVFALNAATGERIWEFDLDPEHRNAKNVNRGVSYWQDRNDKRILFTAGSELIALNAETGKPVETLAPGAGHH